MSDEIITKLIKEARILKAEVAEKSEDLKKVKDQIREFMIDSGIEELEEVKIKRSFSFDAGYFKMQYPKLAEKFIKEETITTVRDVVDKKGIKKHAPEEYKKCLAERTPALYGL